MHLVPQPVLDLPFQCYTRVVALVAHRACGFPCMQVLLRALRDFNLGKLTADDTSIFMGLLNDLFPKTVELVPRAVDREFEAKARPMHLPHPERYLGAWWATVID